MYGPIYYAVGVLIVLIGYFYPIFKNIQEKKERGR